MELLEMPFIECVYERDIDLLLMEELKCNPEFARWFTEKAGLATNPKFEIRCVWHSITEPGLGESDLIALLFSGEERIALLIENKVDAIFQPEQPARYRERGEKGKVKKSWDDFRACIVAPQKYLEGSTQSQQFDSKISYEEIAEWFESRSRDNPRFEYRAKMVQEAIEQSRRGYQVQKDEQVTDFWQRYFLYAGSRFADLGMNPPGIKGWKADWARFFPAGLLPRSRLLHKLGNGCVDLEFAGLADSIKSISKSLEGKLEKKMEIVPAGKSLAIRIKCRTIDRYKSFESQDEVVQEGLEATSRLVEWMKMNQSLLEKAIETRLR